MLTFVDVPRSPPKRQPPPPSAEYQLAYVPRRYSMLVDTAHAQAVRASLRHGLRRSRSVKANRHSAVVDEVLTGSRGSSARVSFGSSKGSMVETVVYDYEPVQTLREEEGCESPDPRASSRHNFATSTPLSAPATR
ncbi:uncharacterized protein LOC119105295 [Pollicipes pollicipes]|uniref:uncharacterized protein LOC119105295 n=1 Tax=Pollicipes pollicipes TaxID=41117 RepID=UPI001884D41F|nr:uncharacterized protein LOC119105295 [Pollicipes pollicipes]